MSFVCPLPPEKVLVRAEYLYDHDPRRAGEFVEGVWVSVKSIRGQAFRFETYLPEFGALYDKLPLSAFVWRYVHDEDELLPLDVLQIWDCMSYHVEVIDKPFLKGLRAEFFGKDKQLHSGEYMLTIDSCNPDPRIPDFGFSETPEEHKSFNLLCLDNGQFALQPNNRCRFFDPAITHSELRMPDFKVCTQTYRVENTAKWRLGDTSTVTYDERGEETTAGTTDFRAIPAVLGHKDSYDMGREDGAKEERQACSELLDDLSLNLSLMSAGEPNLALKLAARAVRERCQR